MHQILSTELHFVMTETSRFNQAGAVSTNFRWKCHSRKFWANPQNEWQFGCGVKSLHLQPCFCGTDTTHGNELAGTIEKGNCCFQQNQSQSSHKSIQNCPPFSDSTLNCRQFLQHTVKILSWFSYVFSNHPREKHCEHFVTVRDVFTVEFMSVATTVGAQFHWFCNWHLMECRENRKSKSNDCSAQANKECADFAQNWSHCLFHTSKMAIWIQPKLCQFCFGACSLTESASASKFCHKWMTSSLSLKCPRWNWGELVFSKCLHFLHVSQWWSGFLLLWHDAIITWVINCAESQTANLHNQNSFLHTSERF